MSDLIVDVRKEGEHYKCEIDGVKISAKNLDFSDDLAEAGKPAYRYEGKVYLAHPYDMQVDVPENPVDLDSAINHVMGKVLQKNTSLAKDYAVETFDPEVFQVSDELIEQIVEVAEHARTEYLKGGYEESLEDFLNVEIEEVLRHTPEYNQMDMPVREVGNEAFNAADYDLMCNDFRKLVQDVWKMKDEDGDPLDPDLETVVRDDIVDKIDELDNSKPLDLLGRNARIGMTFFVGADRSTSEQDRAIEIEGGSGTGDVIVDENFLDALAFLRINPKDFYDYATDLFDMDKDVCERYASLKDKNIRYDEPSVIPLKDLSELLENTRHGGNMVLYGNFNARDFVLRDPGEPIQLGNGVGLNDARIAILNINEGSGDELQKSSFVDLPTEPNHWMIDNKIATYVPGVDQKVKTGMEATFGAEIRETSSIEIQNAPGLNKSARLG